jgi:hypothetical protein
MGYRVPEFPIECQIYGSLFGGDLRLTSECNLAWGQRVNAPSTGGTSEIGVPLITMVLLLPPLTDIRGPLSSTGADGVIVPSGSGRKYTVAFVDDIGKGFSNEHRAAILQQIAQPTPLN